MSPTSSRTSSVRRLAALALLCASCASPDRDEVRALREYLDTEFRADAPGGVVLVARGDEILVHKAYGLAELEDERAMTVEDVLCIGSVTKTFAAAAILRLVEEGAVALDEDVRLHVPEAPTAGHTVTLEQLLTHTSGMPNLVDLPDFMEWAETERTTAELVAATRGMEWLSAPGDAFHYSDSGYILLGALVENVTGLAFDEYVVRELAGPLGMTNTRSAHRPRGNESVGYSHGRPAEAIHMSVPHASGQLASTAADLRSWVRAWRDAEVVSRELRERAWAGRELPDGTHSGYGFGWKRDHVAGQASVGHGGWVPGFTATVLHLPDDDLTAIALVNSEDGTPEAGYVARRCLRLMLTGSPRLVPVPVGAERRAQLTGRYVTDGGSELLVQDRDGGLFILWGGDEIELMALTTSRFAAADSDGTWRFTFDEEHATPSELRVSLSGEPQARARRSRR